MEPDLKDFDYNIQYSEPFWSLTVKRGANTPREYHNFTDIGALFSYMKFKFRDEIGRVNPNWLEI